MHTLETSTVTGKRRVRFPCYHLLFQYFWLSRVRGSVSVKQQSIKSEFCTLLRLSGRHPANVSASTHPPPPPAPPPLQTLSSLSSEDSSGEVGQDYKWHFHSRDHSFQPEKFWSLYSSSESCISRNTSFKCGGIWDRF